MGCPLWAQGLCRLAGSQQCVLAMKRASRWRVAAVPSSSGLRGEAHPALTWRPRSTVASVSTRMGIQYNGLQELRHRSK